MDSVQKIINIIAEYDCESFINIVILALKKNGYDKIIAVSKAKSDNIEGLCEACTKGEVTHFINKMDSQVQY